MDGIKRLDLDPIMKSGELETLYRLLEKQRKDVFMHFGACDTNRELMKEIGRVANFTSGQLKSFLMCGKVMIIGDHFIAGYLRGDGQVKQVYLDIIRGT